MATSRFSSPNV